MVETYEQSLINYTWFIELERVDGGVKLLRYYRKRFDAKDRPKTLGMGHVVESDDGQRTVIAVEILPFQPSRSVVTRLDVVNPAHVFSYNMDGA